jgi:Ca-activated chloride channel family protein
MKQLSMVFLLLTGWVLLYGQVIIMPPPESREITPQEIELRSTNLDVSIKNGTADVTLDQVFYNPGSRRLEGEYILMLPGESQVYDFYLDIDGQRVRGEILDGKKAQDVYETIVRKLKDPALLQAAGNGMFRARIFPMEPKSERKIRVSYVQVLKNQMNNFRFQFPLKQDFVKGKNSVHMNIVVEDDRSVANVYSPTHTLETIEKTDKRVRLTAEISDTQPNSNFILFYSNPRKGMNYSFITFRPRTDRDGYFLLQINPPEEREKYNRPGRDVIFVMDISGSMQGGKIEQARKALRFCVDALGKEDRFDIIAFSSTIQSFQGKLVGVTTDSRQNVMYFIDNLRASGGTNIDQALQTAMKLSQSASGRTTDMIFLTDGLPTEGQTDISKILENVLSLRKQNVRIFAFGVGWEVNTFLLDKLTQDTGGSVEYVKPGEDIESVISFLFEKITRRALTDITIEFQNGRVNDVYPVKIPDLFYGERLTLLGRYGSAEDLNIRMSGSKSGRPVKYDFTANLPQRESQNDFISKLWANRKVSHLLTEIRFRGEIAELVESIRDLGLEYGIITPYTSYLVTEQEKELTFINNRRDNTVSGERLMRLQESRKRQSAVDEESVGSAIQLKALSAMPTAPASSSGKNAVIASKAMKKLESSDKNHDMLLTVRRLDERTFQLRNGVWQQLNLPENPRADIPLPFLSDAYFDFLRKNSTVGQIFALGENLLFEWNGQIVKVFEEK